MSLPTATPAPIESPWLNGMSSGMRMPMAPHELPVAKAVAADSEQLLISVTVDTVDPELTGYSVPMLAAAMVPLPA